MKNYGIATLIAISTLSIHSQEGLNKAIDVAKGDIIKVGNPSSKSYRHTKLPRGNFVGTKNGVADYKSALEKELVIADIKEITKGSTIISVKRKDGKKFFNTVATLNVCLEKALGLNEIKLWK